MRSCLNWGARGKGDGVHKVNRLTKSTESVSKKYASILQSWETRLQKTDDGQRPPLQGEEEKQKPRRRNRLLRDSVWKFLRGELSIYHYTTMRSAASLQSLGPAESTAFACTLSIWANAEHAPI